MSETEMAVGSAPFRGAITAAVKALDDHGYPWLATRDAARAEAEEARKVASEDRLEWARLTIERDEALARAAAATVKQPRAEAHGEMAPGGTS